MKLIININIIPPIPSIDIFTFAYLNSNNNIDNSPIEDMLTSNPFVLYLIINSH